MREYLFLMMAVLVPQITLAQWVNKGPMAPVSGSPDIPFERSWTKPVFDTIHNHLIYYFSNPNCCMGTFSNGLFWYDATANAWSLAWSHGTTQNTGGPADSKTAPSDNHPYHFMAWDIKRGVVWKGFGSAVTGGTTGNCGDCGVSDLYSFDVTSKSWNELCGNTVVACPPNTYQAQETAAAYDPLNDVIIMYGGLVRGSPVADLWAYYPVSNTWREVCGQEPGVSPRCPAPQLRQHTMVSIGNGFIYLFGGMDQRGVPQNQTWAIDTGSLTMTQITGAVNPLPQRFPVMDYVAKLNSLVLVDAQSPAHVWKFNIPTSTWSDMNIPAGPTLRTTSSSNQGGYDPVADKFVLVIASSGNPNSYVWQLQLPNAPVVRILTPIIIQRACIPGVKNAVCP